MTLAKKVNLNLQNLFQIQNMARPGTSSHTKKVQRLTANDPLSFSNPNEVKAEKMLINWDVDFKAKTFTGQVTYNVVKLNKNAQHMILDTRDLTIKFVKNNGQDLEYSVGEGVRGFGKPLKVKLPECDKNQRCSFSVSYVTSGQNCLVWFTPAQTTDKTHPFVFSQGQAINMRSLLPCQDTPSIKQTYEAIVNVPMDFEVVMSAMTKDKPKDPFNDNNKMQYSFEQKIPVPSYLIAIAVGKLSSIRISPKTTIYAEPSVVLDAAAEFSDTEDMLAIAEKFCGPYVWHDYNLLVLPGSFAFGGMENPCCTFITPSLLAGDKSLTDVLIHEIAHSWTGNLVTFKTFEHFWLSEGFTMYVERRILRQTHGETYRQFQAMLGLKSLKDCIEEMGPTNPYTKLVPDLTGVDPDNIFSDVPYEKGFTFLYYLEQIVGGIDAFCAFVRHYIEINKFKSIDTDTFKNQFIEYFTRRKKTEELKKIEWDKWLYTPGMPYIVMNYQNSLGESCEELRDKWRDWKPEKEGSEKPESPFSKQDLEEFRVRPAQLQYFLSLMLEGRTPLELVKVQAMQDAYDLNSIKNAEIRFRWCRICIRAKWTDQLQLILQFITDYGRQRYLLPIYRDLVRWDAAASETWNTYLKTSETMGASTHAAVREIICPLLRKFHAIREKGIPGEIQLPTDEKSLLEHIGDIDEKLLMKK